MVRMDLGVNAVRILWIAVVEKETGLVSDVFRQTGMSCRTRDALRGPNLPPPDTLFSLSTEFCSLGCFLFLSLCWSESEPDIVRVLMGYKWDISSLCQTCWEIFNLIFFLLYTYIFVFFHFQYSTLKNVSVLSGFACLCKSPFLRQPCLLSCFAPLSLTAF